MAYCICVPYKSSFRGSEHLKFAIADFSRNSPASNGFHAGMPANQLSIHNQGPRSIYRISNKNFIFKSSKLNNKETCGNPLFLSTGIK